jgi:hypothetical protein
MARLQNLPSPFTFSGDCSGKITDTVMYKDRDSGCIRTITRAGKWSYFRVYTVDWTNMLLEDILYTQSVGSTTSVSVNKGKLNAKLSDTSAANSARHWIYRRIHSFRC